MATLKSTTVDSAGGTDASITEDGVDRNSGSNLTFNIQNSGAGTMTIQQDGTAVMLTGKHKVPVMAIGMKPSTTSGASGPSWTETTTNDIMLGYIEFADGSTTYAHFSVPMPKSWNEGTITYVIRWYSPTNTGNVVWGLQAVAVSNDDPLDASWGTEQTVTDGVTATGDYLISAESSALTVGGTPATDDAVYFRVYRKGADASDTVAAAVRLLSIDLFVNYDVGNDA